jgi:hypothetical protein
MEHRYHVRVPVDVSMLIYRRGLPVATGRVRNASKAGLFVLTDYAELREHQPLEFELCLGGEPAGMRQRVNAHVRRRTSDGMALEIDELDRAASGALGALVGGQRNTVMGTAGLASAGS